MRGANSVASDFSKFCTPARAAEVQTMCGSGCIDNSELTATMAARSLFSRSGRNARMGKIWLKNFNSSSSRHCRSLVLAKVETRPCPALLTRRSTRPPLQSPTFCAKTPTALASSTSQRSASNTSDLAPSCAVAAANRSPSRPQIATRAPSASSNLAVASPMPELPPVTTATLFVKPRSTIVLVSCCRPRRTSQAAYLQSHRRRRLEATRTIPSAAKSLVRRG